MRTSRTSIRSKLWLSIFSLVVLILLMIWLFQVIFLNYFYISERTGLLKEEGIRIAEIMANKIAESGNMADDYSSEELNEEIESFTNSLHGTIIIFDAKGNVIFLNNEPQSNEKDLSKKKTYQYRLTLRIKKDLEVMSKIAEQEIFEIKNKEYERPFVLVGVPIYKDSKFLGTVLLETPLAPIHETIRILKKQLALISLVSLGVGTILALLLSRQFTKPIVKITEAAQKIAKGDFNWRVQVNSNDEIGTLGEIINDLPVKLQKLENFRRDFIANTSHELKTPISLIQAYAELIRDIEGEDKKVRDENLQVIIEEAARLNHMVEDILYLSQIESGNSKLKLKTFSLWDLLNRVIKKVSFFTDKKSIRILLNVDEDAKVCADEEKMQQVFLNLLNNAINHSQENSEITINMSEDYKIEIIDQGEGIPAEDLPYIWDRFYKVDKSRKRDNNSTGLGMAIVKNILQAHGFQYGITSKLKEGTSVWIKIK